MNSKNYIWGSLALATIALLIAFAWWGRGTSSVPLFPAVVANEIHNGNYRAALDAADAVRTSQEASADEKAMAYIETATLPYELSGNISDAVASVRQLKTIASDQRVSIPVRKIAVNILGLWYKNSGSNREVFKEIFKDDPYKKYIVSGHNNESVRNLLIAGYRDMPSARNAVAIAASYISDLYSYPNIASSTRAEYVSKTERYLSEASLLVTREGEGRPQYTSSRMYAGILMGQAYSVAGLADFASKDVYKKQYRSSYNDLISFLEHGTLDQKRSLASAHWRYATYLLNVDNDKQAARQELIKAIRAVSENPASTKDPLVVLIEGLKQRIAKNDKTVLTSKLQQTIDLSQEFKAFVNTLK